MRLLLALALFADVLLACTSAVAAEGMTADIDRAHMTTGLFGGLALLLFNMAQMSDALISRRMATGLYYF